MGCKIRNLKLIQITAAFSMLAILLKPVQPVTDNVQLAATSQGDLLLEGGTRCYFSSHNRGAGLQVDCEQAACPSG